MLPVQSVTYVPVAQREEDEATASLAVASGTDERLTAPPPLPGPLPRGEREFMAVLLGCLCFCNTLFSFGAARRTAKRSILTRREK
ncbi:hypothetical protein RE428_28850 [Marinobacter nanhaiticus D15-8W]|nr:hypothetical protein RE428_28850 [Marinobacter nanhaiticus D15-8W]